jgi:hypothetical protein
MRKKFKYPKQPKISASINTWLNYEQRIKDIDAANRQLEAEKRKKEQIISRAKRAKSGVSGTRRSRRRY